MKGKILYWKDTETQVFSQFKWQILIMLFVYDMKIKLCWPVQ